MQQEKREGMAVTFYVVVEESASTTDARSLNCHFVVPIPAQQLLLQFQFEKQVQRFLLSGAAAAAASLDCYYLDCIPGLGSGLHSDSNRPSDEDGNRQLQGKE